MRALVITGPNRAEVQDVAAPAVVPGEVVVDVARVGICGTDIELFNGEMQYLRTGHAAYPLRIGHEWMGTVTTVGDGVDEAWLGRRVTGDTSLGCGACDRCRTGRKHVCESRSELGVRGGRPGALAEQVAVPESALLPLPDSVSGLAGALVEPGGNSLRSVLAAGVRPGERALIFGTSTIGLLAAMFARSRGIEVQLVGRSAPGLAFARTLGFDDVTTADAIPDVRWDTVIDASNGPGIPAQAVRLVEPGRRVVLVGIAGNPSMIDTRELVLADVTVAGLLSGSPAFDETIRAYAEGHVDPSPLVSIALSLEEVPAALAGHLPVGAGAGPKIHVSI